ncbi:MAG: peptidase [Calditrichaeota bacterium]|nr:peptidase [Calditrichota bacterium]
MKNWYLLWSAILVTFVFVIGCGEKKQIKLEKADVNHVKAQLQKFAPVEIAYDQKILTDKDQQVMQKLVEAANYIDQIFLRQVYSKNEGILQALKNSQQTDDKVYLDYFKIMYGPFDRLNENTPFLVAEPKPKGANFYPEDLTKDEFHNWLKNHPEDKEAFESNFTVIRRDGDKLKAIPYSEAYKDLLKPAAKLLKQAADLSENESLKKFLTSRAEAFLSNDYFQSDMDWMDLDSQIEIVIGPYEVYEDELFGYKASFEAFICAVDPVESEKLQVIAKYLKDMEKNLPYADKYKNFDRGSSSPIKVVQEIYTAGDARAGVQTLAFNLPNDEKVREAKGSKKVLLKNVQEAKFEKILMPIMEKVITKDQLPLLSFDAYFNHILLHEVSHGLGPGTLTLANGEKTTVNKMLKETYSTIEEAKADVCGNYNVQFLIDKGIFPKDLEKSLYVTYLGGIFRSVRFGINEAHGMANMIQFNFLMENNAFNYDEATGKFSVDQARAKTAVRNLAHVLLTIEAEGNYDAAKELIKNYGVMTEEMKAALDKLTDIPVDIKPIYEVKLKIKVYNH